MLNVFPEGTLAEKRPFSSVRTSTAVPLTKTLAPAIGVLPSEESTCPESLPSPVTFSASFSTDAATATGVSISILSAPV
jgi:hypothetical protein